MVFNVLIEETFVFVSGSEDASDTWSTRKVKWEKVHVHSKKNPATRFLPGYGFDVFRVSDDSGLIRSYYDEGRNYTPNKVCVIFLCCCFELLSLINWFNMLLWCSPCSSHHSRRKVQLQCLNCARHLL